MRLSCSRRGRCILRGATVLRGPMGFGHSSRIHTTKILRLSQDLPIVIEIVDAEDKIIKMLRYGNGKPKA
jgi:PII-like signaling protein